MGMSFLLNVLNLTNGSIKVLSAIGLEKQPGTISWIEGAEYTSTGELLGTFDQSYFKDEYGFSSFGVRRSDLQQRSRQEAMRQGIPIYQGWELETLQDAGDSITATAKDGRRVTASLVIGCDGLHSKTRQYVLGKHDINELHADNTGLVMVSESE